MKRRILVVDDESIVAHDISECLTHMGCEVVGTALSGPDAIAKAAKLRPDLVMMDIVLQGPMDGVEAATVIRQKHDIPCVFLTAYSDGAVLARAKAAAPAGYMVKPFEEAGLRSTVEIALYKVDLERALRESREWFLTTLMSIADAVIATDSEGRVKFLNPRAEALSGWASHEAERHTVEQIFPLTSDRDGAPVPSLLRSALAEGSTQVREKGVTMVSRDGRKIPVADSAAPIRDREGNLVGAVIIFRDDTGRRLHEQGLEQQQARLEELVKERTGELLAINTRLQAEVEERRRAEQALAARVELERMLSSVSALFLATKPDETDDAMVQAMGQIGGFLNVDRCYIMQYSPGRRTLDSYIEWCAAGVPATGESFRGVEAVVLPSEFEDPRNRTSGIVAFTAKPEGSGAMNAELARERAAGSVLWLRLGQGESSHGFLCIDSLSRREWNAETLRALAMASAVVETAFRRLAAERDKERLQSQLQQSMKMEAVGKLSGGIAHDFNNMLLPIIGYSDMVLLRLPENDPSVLELREVKRAAERASALTRQLLAFSRKQVARKTIFDLNDNLGNMNRMLGRIIGEDINLRMELSQDPVPVKADQGQIEQVVMNLIINARDAMPGGGSIVVRTMLVDATRYPVPVIGGLASEGTYAVLTVADTGCGIPKELQDRIFEPFYTTKGMEGTGLGLSVIYGIIQDHQGGLQLSSTPGKGTTFHIFLPASRQAAPVLPVEGVAKPVNGKHFRGQGQRVLLVEDEEAVNHLVRTALTQNGYVVTSAATVSEARALFDESSGQFEMIFSDAVLPDGNGLQLLDTFLTRNPGLRALLSSGYTDKTSLLEMARHRRISFLPKPYSLPVLFQTVAEVMEDQNAHLLD
ncbi:MAG TPA: response regulator [Verrucomicrobiales bacterium]|jgi:PAS domain S-box-containing protein|nr:response regulator [Verrucomicrobiales bacterium]